MMKKSLFMLGAAVLMLASCTNEEVLNVADSRAIGFNGTGIDNITRARDITSSGFNQFYVYGGYGENAIFDKISVTKGESGGWTYTPPQYWANGIWNFAGYAGDDGVNPSWNNTEGKLTLAVNSDQNNQSDVIFANAKSITVDDAATYSKQVTLNFTHLLSKIQFKFTKNTDLKGVTVKLTDFKIESLTTKAKWVDGVQNDADSPATGNYTDFTEAQILDNDNGKSTAEFYVIPQTTQAFNISVTAEITDNNGTEIKTGTVTASLPTTTISSWKAQNKYVYTAELKYENIVSPDPEKDPKPIVFTGSATDWETPEGNKDNITLSSAQ